MNIFGKFFEQFLDYFKKKIFGTILGKMQKKSNFGSFYKHFWKIKNKSIKSLQRGSEPLISCTRLIFKFLTELIDKILYFSMQKKFSKNFLKLIQKHSKFFSTFSKKYSVLVEVCSVLY